MILVPHTFIYKSFAKALGLKAEPLGYVLEVETLFENSCITTSICRSCYLAISGQELFVDLVVLEMLGYDVILGMDWLSSNQVVMDCYSKKVTFCSPDKVRFPYIGTSIFPYPIQC